MENERPTSVVGDFNHWDPLVMPMHAKGDRTYQLHLLLKPGRYSFRYLADEGHWFDDESADGHESDAFGAANFRVEYEAAERLQPEAAKLCGIDPR